jgi:hypothetical protein
VPFKPHPTDPTKVIYKTSEYWIPKPWQGLTDDDHKDFADRTKLLPILARTLAEFIEAKLKEKNGG